MAKNGYVRLRFGDERIFLHRYLMEQHLGRKLSKDERLHHVNGNKADNRIENLELMSSHSRHIALHHADMWKSRKRRPALPPEEIQQIMEYLSLPWQTHKTCFCGKKVMGRNLCERHYFWARYHHQFVSRAYHKKK